MKLILTLALLLTAAPVFAYDLDEQLQLNVILLLVRDAQMTSGMVREGWVGRYETNPILGRFPSSSKTDGYFAGCLLAEVIAHKYLHTHASRLMKFGLIALQGWAVTNNAINGVSADMEDETHGKNIITLAWRF